jgi:hypothetical protein
MIEPGDIIEIRGYRHIVFAVNPDRENYAESGGTVTVTIHGHPVEFPAKDCRVIKSAREHADTPPDPTKCWLWPDGFFGDGTPLWVRWIWAGIGFVILSPVVLFLIGWFMQPFVEPCCR